MKQARVILAALGLVGFACMAWGSPPAEGNKVPASIEVTLPTLNVDHKAAHDAFRITEPFLGVLQPQLAEGGC
jgi:hypothetical protein